eukprot:TRINITY_DN6108_c0_g1_i1.p1 TRINITY_DN6108_c0_g1~~TRINITY_DN6108_c0_g1_i1.p1  ORF type:complete len:437 (+),score=63.78 TRINITY_DN6108_c0_g1_i1:43-1353(+)
MTLRGFTGRGSLHLKGILSLHGLLQLHLTASKSLPSLSLRFQWGAATLPPSARRNYTVANLKPFVCIADSPRSRFDGASAFYAHSFGMTDFGSVGIIRGLKRSAIGPIFEDSAQISRHGSQDIFAAFSLKCKRGKLEVAASIFEKIQRLNLLIENKKTYAGAIFCYWKLGRSDKAYSCYREMVKKIFKPDRRTFSVLIEVLFKEGNYDKVVETFDQMIDFKIRPDGYAYGYMIKLYAEKGDLEKSRKLFEEVKAIKLGYAPATFAWNCMIEALGFAGLHPEAMAVHLQMKEAKVSADVATFNAVIGACGRNGFPEMARKYFRELTKSTIGKPNVDTYQKMIEIYVNSQQFDEAISMFEQMISNGVACNLTIFNMVIKAYGGIGDVPEAMAAYQKMLKQQIAPNQQTYETMISILKAAGMNDEAINLFNMKMYKFRQ